MTETSSPNDTDNSIETKTGIPQTERAPEQVTYAQPIPQAVAPAQPASQYVVSEKSLQGLGGWLVFWVIVLGFYSVYGILFTFVWFASLAESSSADPNLIVAAIFTPIIAACFLTSLILISMQKKLGKLLALISFGVVGLFATVSCIVAMARQYCNTSYTYSYYNSASQTTCNGASASAVIMLVGVIISVWVGVGLISLYFLKSRRVQQTLIK